VLHIYIYIYDISNLMVKELFSMSVSKSLSEL
jgi:hypothetical protein